MSSALKTSPVIRRAELRQERTLVGSGLIRRWLRIALLAAVLLVAIRFTFPKTVDSISWEIRHRWHTVMYSTSVQFEGNALIRSEELEIRVPADAAVWSWFLDSSGVLATIASHPLVAQVDAERCRWWTFACYRVQITERKAQALARFQSALWVVGEDGGFMAPAPAVLLSGGGDNKPGLLLIEGTDGYSATPGLLRDQMAAGIALSQHIKELLGLTVKRLNLLPRGEVLLTLAELKTPIQLDLGDPKRSEVEIQRLHLLLPELAKLAQPPELIDLSFDSMAVFKMPHQAEPAKAVPARSSRR